MSLARLPSPLLLITDRHQARRPLVEVIEAALVGGCRWVSVREKDLLAFERLTLVQEILPLVHGFGGTLLVHADVGFGAPGAEGDPKLQMLDLDVVRHADGVHLPAGANVADARERLGDKYIIGLSCHNLDDVAQARGADYVTLGPFAPTLSKPGYMPTFGPELLGKAAVLGVPVLALGGVDETNVRGLRRAGAAGFAMMGSVMRSDDPEALVRRMLEQWARET